MSHIEERNHENTVFVGELDSNVDEALLWELMVQVGPVVSVYIPRDKLTKEHSRYGFVEFQSEADVEYACKIMNGVSLFNFPIRVNRSGRDRKLFDIGANLFVGNLDVEMDDRQLSDVFKQFGGLIGPAKVARDETSGVSKGYAFVYYDSFEAADAAIAALNGQFLGGKRVTVNYSFKKDKPGERHGDAAERMLAAKNPLTKHRKDLQAAGGQASPAPPPQTAPPPYSASAPHGAPPPFMQQQQPPPPHMPYGGVPPQFAPPAIHGYAPAPQYGMPPPPPQYGQPAPPMQYAPYPPPQQQYNPFPR